MSTKISRGLAASTAAGLIAGGALAASPAHAASNAENVTDATFHWGISKEATGGAYFGGCNFPVAGESGDAGSSRVWNDSIENFDELFNPADGNVSIVRPAKDDAKDTPLTWENKCMDAAGEKVTTGNGKSTGFEVKIADGNGTVDPVADTGSIEWDGSFTLVFYGGMTYWTVSNPKLEVENGHGKLTGTFSGYGASMDDPDKWESLPKRDGVIADFKDSHVDLTENGFSVLPDYKGVEVETTDGFGEQVKSGDNWGSFPQSWVDYNNLTGQSSYWYSSGGARDQYKPATQLSADYSYSEPTPAPEDKKLKAPTPKVSGTAQVGKKLSAKAGTWTSGAQLKYQWLRDGKAIGKATKSSYTAVAADKGKNLSVKVTGSKAGYKTAAKTSKATAAVKAGTITAGKVKASGSAKVGKTLKVKKSGWKPGGLTYSYQWLANGKKIPKATKSNYKIAKKYTGKKLSVKITGKKSGYATKAKSSAKTGTVKK